MLPLSDKVVFDRTWESLANSAAGRPALVIGKGPSLDAWLAAKQPQPENAVLIGVNHAAAIVPCHFAATTHGEHDDYGTIQTQWLVAIPYAGKTTPPPWAAHWFIHLHGFHLLNQSRADIARAHILWNQSSSAHPAIHLAWYLGCTSLTLVGLDGGHGYAQAVKSTTSPPVNPNGYRGTRKDTDKGAALLFGTSWGHWGPPH